MSLKQFFIVLRARWVSVVAVWLAITLAVAAVSFIRTPQFTATAAVVLDIKSPDPIAGIALPAMQATTYMATQIGVVQSERVTLRAVDALGLASDEQLRAVWAEKSGGTGDFRAWIAESLQRKIDVTATRDANIISVAFTSSDAARAAAVANALVKAYIDTTVDLRVEPARQYSSFFDARAKQLREDLEMRQSKLSAYQRANGIVVTDDRLDVEMLRLSELSTQLVALQGVATESSKREGLAAANADRLPEVVANPLVVDLRSELSRQETRLNELASRLGSGHPQLIEAKASVEQLRARVATETRRIASSVALNNSVNQGRVVQLRNEVEAQRNRILQLRNQRDESALMLRDVESAQRSYDAMLVRASQAGVESQATQTNVSVLRSATVPVSPSSPRTVLDLLIGCIGGALFALAVAILRESLDRRLRSDADVVLTLRTTLLGSLPRISSAVRSGQARLRLMGDNGSTGAAGH